MRPRLQKLPREPQAQPQPVPMGDRPPSEAELRTLISEAAYYRAEKRGFAPGLEAEDWRAAEAEVMEARARAREPDLA